MSFTPQPLHRPGKNPHYPYNKRLGDPQRPYGFLQKRYISCPCRDPTPSHPTRSLVAIPTTFIPTHSVDVKCSIRFNVLIRFAVGPHQWTLLPIITHGKYQFVPPVIIYYSVSDFSFLPSSFFLSVRPNTKITYPEVSSKIYHDSFCQLGSNVSLLWVIYFEAFYLHVVSSFSCIPVISPKLVLFLAPLQFCIFVL